MIVKTYECDRCKAIIPKEIHHTVDLNLTPSGEHRHYDLCGMCVNQFMVLMSGDPVRGVRD